MAGLHRTRKETAMQRSEIVVKCCRCHRVRIAGQWQPEEREDPAERRYSHSFCPACLLKVHADLEVIELAAG